MGFGGGGLCGLYDGGFSLVGVVLEVRSEGGEVEGK